MADGFNQLTPESLKSVDGLTELNRMLQILFDLVAGDGDSVRIYAGYGAPAISAGDGSLYLRKDGGAGTTLYVMESGSWTAK